MPARPNRKLRGRSVDQIVAYLVRKGARVYNVHYRAQGARLHSTRRMLVTRKGHMFFPDHGFCTVSALRAEADFTYRVRVLTPALAFENIAMFLAMYAAGAHRSAEVSLRDATYIKNANWWEKGCWDFIREISAKRSIRATHASPTACLDQLVTDGVPFSKSINVRANFVIERTRARTIDKLRRVLAAKGAPYTGSVYYHSATSYAQSSKARYAPLLRVY